MKLRRRGMSKISTPATSDMIGVMWATVRVICELAARVDGQVSIRDPNLYPHRCQDRETRGRRMGSIPQKLPKIAAVGIRLFGNEPRRDALAEVRLRQQPVRKSSSRGAGLMRNILAAAALAATISTPLAVQAQDSSTTGVVRGPAVVV